MGDTRQAIQKKAKRRRRWRIILFVVLVFVFLIGGYGAYAFYNINKAADKSYHPIQRETGYSKYREADVTIGKNPISILLLGVEDYATKGKGGRTDTIILATLNPHTHKMTITSIPRDSRVPIANRGNQTDKINAAYNDGVENTIDTVENFLHVPIDYYVTIGFKGFAEGIDQIGGVDVDVPFDFWEKDIFNHNKHINFKKGPMHLNGNQALAYVRMRYRDPRGDFGRNDRQRQVIKAAVQQAISTKTLFKLDELSNIVGKHVQTNLKLSEIYGLEQAYAKSGSSVESFDLEKDGQGGKDPNNGVWYFYPDENQVSQVSAEIRKQLELGDNRSTSNETAQTSQERSNDAPGN
ncbi:LCP family protein [Camelliibacillus cellulosilyticus]|uniref:LCP family protein n=1 Tax=Camelliibacillus cellulosilyticus TaxID=2174486 RepID=A0ABV9GMM0_9BACL